MSESERKEYIRRGVENHKKAGRSLKRYNLTLDDYERMLDAQGGVCAICRKPPGKNRLSVDHDHSCCEGSKSCGKCVRGLLCITCNTWLGFYENDVWMAGAKQYLTEVR